MNCFQLIIASGVLVIVVFLPFTDIDAVPFTTSIPCKPFAIAVCVAKPNERIEMIPASGFNFRNLAIVEVEPISVSLLLPLLRSCPTVISETATN